MQISSVEECLFAAMDAKDVIVLALDGKGQIMLHSTVTYPPDILWAFETTKGTVMDMFGSATEGEA